MPVNKEELARDLETPEYQNIVKETLTKKDFIIRTKTEENQFQELFKKDVVEKEIPQKIKAVHDQYDKDIKETFGVDRSQDEKTFDYLKRVAKATITERDRLKAEIAKGDPTGAIKQQLEEAERKAQAAIAERDGRIKTLETEITTTRKSSTVSQAYAGIRAQFKKELPPLFDITEKAILEDVTRNSVVKDGVLYMANADGSIKKDASFKEITADAYLATAFKDLIDVKKQGGAGSGNNPPDPNKGSDVSKIDENNFQMPDRIKSAGDLMEYMQEIGLKRGSPQFTKIWNKFSKDLTREHY